MEEKDSSRWKSDVAKDCVKFAIWRYVFLTFYKWPSSKCLQSNLTRGNDVNVTILSKISTVTMTRFHVALASMASGCFGNKHGVSVG